MSLKAARAYQEWKIRMVVPEPTAIDSFIAGAAWAARTPAECGVIEAAIVYSKTTGGGSTVRALRNVLNAVAALEREKVEGAK